MQVCSVQLEGYAERCLLRVSCPSTAPCKRREEQFFQVLPEIPLGFLCESVLGTQKPCPFVLCKKKKMVKVPEMEIGEELSSGGCWAVLVHSDNVKLGFLISRWLKKALPVALSVPVPAEDFVPKQSLVNANLFFPR